MLDFYDKAMGYAKQTSRTEDIVYGASNNTYKPKIISFIGRCGTYIR